MSALVIAALRSRAVALKEEAHTLRLGGEAPPGPQGRPRPPEPLLAAVLLVIATEFRKLADEAEGREP